MAVQVLAVPIQGPQFCLDKHQFYRDKQLTEAILPCRPSSKFNKRPYFKTQSGKQERTMNFPSSSSPPQPPQHAYTKHKHT